MQKPETLATLLLLKRRPATSECDAFVELSHREALKITSGVLPPLFLSSLDRTIAGAALSAIDHFAPKPEVDS